MQQEELFKKTINKIDPNKIFLLMPFRPELDEVYKDIVKPVLEDLGYKVYRADEIYSTNPIISDIWEAIQTAGIIIADMTNRNPNVFYELGLAHAIGKSVILITQSIDDVPFDLRHLRCIEYKNTVRGSTQLSNVLRKTISQDFSYTKIPIGLLAKKFSGGFLAESISSEYHFAGVRGSRALISENYKVFAEHENLIGFYKKVNYSGKVGKCSIDHGVINTETIFPGMDVWEIIFSNPLGVDKPHQFKLEYELIDSFSGIDEFWNYVVEVDTGKLDFVFHFDKEQLLESFHIFEVKDGKEVLTEHQPTVVSEHGEKTVSWSEQNLQKGRTIVFRWKWH